MLKRVLPVVAGLVVAMPAGIAQGSDLPGAPQQQTQAGRGGQPDRNRDDDHDHDQGPTGASRLIGAQ